MAERMDPETLAYTMSEAIADQESDPNAYLRRFLEELLTLEPDLRQHVSDLLIAELKEEVARREDSRHAHATVTLIERIEDTWRTLAEGRDG
jgi:hypothetical protein